MSAKPLIRVVVGPTASGKTNYAISLAQKIGGAVISADSRQLYAGMDVGTATPAGLSHSVSQESWQSQRFARLSPRGFANFFVVGSVSPSKYLTSTLRSNTRRTPRTWQNGTALTLKRKKQQSNDLLTPDIIEGVPHYLLNIRAPDNPMTLSEWQAAAFKVISHIIEQGQQPILAGGTMLYVDSIVFNYDIPNVEPDDIFRASLSDVPAEELYAQLLEKDPASSSFIEPHNTQRIIRALEVIEKTGKPFSELRRAQESDYVFEIVSIKRSWDKLEQRIEKRAEKMIANGLLDEVAELRSQYGTDLPLLKTMNYREAGQLLDKKFSKKEALAEMVRANLRYARRQMSWWRGRSDVRWIRVPHASNED